MPNQQKPSKRKATKRTRRAGRRARGNKQTTNVPNGNISMAKTVCSLTNPFCPEAWGARWPDNSMTKSVAWTGDAIHTLTTNAEGSAAILINGNHNQNTSIASLVASGIITFPDFANYAPPPSDTARWRTTSYGVKLRCLQAKLSAQGMVRVRLFSPQNFGGLESSFAETMYADAIYDVPLSRLIDKDLFIIPAPLGADARLFRDPDESQASITTGKNMGFQVAQISIMGASATTAALEVRTIHHYEYVFNDHVANNAFAVPPPKASTVAQDATPHLLQDVGNFVEGIADTVDRVFKSRAVGLLADGAGYLLSL